MEVFAQFHAYQVIANELVTFQGDFLAGILAVLTG
jgi:hypothetical protein